MLTVFLALAQHNNFSDVLRGKFLPALAERFRVVVLTPIIDEKAAEAGGYFRHPNVSYLKLPLTYPKLWMIFDKYLRVPLNREFDHLVYMKYFYRRDHWWPRKLLMRLRVLLPKSLMTTDRLTAWEKRWAKPSPQFLELVRRYRPPLLITATPGFKAFEAEMIIFAQHLGLETVAVNINYDNLTSTGKLIRKTDYLAVWNDLMRREAQTLHRYPNERLKIVDCLRFDHYFSDPADSRFPSRDDFIEAKNLDPSRRTIVFAGPTPSNYPPRREFVEELLRLKQQGQLHGDPNVLIRIHPNDSLGTYHAFLDRPGVRLERASRELRPGADGGKVEMDEEDALNLTATLKYADVLINFASTVAIESCIFDRPVINVAFPEYRRIVYQYEYNRYIVDTKAVRLAESPAELARLVNMYLDRPAADREFRSRLLEEFIPFRDGQSWRRTVDFVESIAAKQWR